MEQAQLLAEQLAGCGIRHIVSSPFLRAVQTAAPLSAITQLSVEPDDRLAERRSAFEDGPGWEGRLLRCFTDMDYVRPGWESDREAMARGVATVEAVCQAGSLPAALISHGKLLTLILHHYDSRFGYEDWLAMTNPDVFILTRRDGVTSVERPWSW